MLTVSLAFAAWYGRRHGKQFALGAGMAVSMLAGTWFEIEILGTPINVTMATAIILLVVYCTHSWREIFKAINLLDVLITTLFLWHIVVDVYYDGTPLPVAAQAYGQWLLPYAAGRYAFLHRDALPKVAPVFAIVGAIISVLCVAEAWTGTNLWETAFTPRDDKVSFVGQMRYGIAYRACGPTRHAIFLSNVLLILLPFAVLLTQRDISWWPRIGRWNRLLGPVLLTILLVGVASSVSRGPVITLFIASCLALAWYYRPAAWFVAGITVLLAVWIATDLNGFLRLLETDEKEYQRTAIVQVNGEDEGVIQSGTRNRLNILRVYGPIFLSGGPLGYGSTTSSGFPPRGLPGLPTNPKDRNQIAIVDNAFLNIGLASGWIGATLFLSLFLLAAFTTMQASTRASTYLYPLDQRFFIAAAGLFAAFLFEISTVFWSYDYYFWILFMFGVIAGVSSTFKRQKAAAV